MPSFLGLLADHYTHDCKIVFLGKALTGNQVDPAYLGGPGKNIPKRSVRSIRKLRRIEYAQGRNSLFDPKGRPELVQEGIWGRPAFFGLI